MSRGLPIVTTPNSGSPVRDGVEGFVRAYDDVDGFHEAIMRLDDDRDLLLEMGNAARRRVLEFSIERYQTQLADHFRQLLNIH